MDQNRYPAVPMLGAAYYPEDWDESEQAKDIAMMCKAGINTVRIAEFAWSCMEPSDGDFRFDWLHRVIDRLKEAGIAVILGTPSATPPIWVEEKDPDMLVLNAQHQRALHGGRRHCCSNNETYRFYCFRIAEEMAKEFGQDENVIGWQIDNEIFWHDDFGCFCEACQSGFHAFLKERYGSAEAINKAWNLNLFSQHYDKIQQIPAPANSWHNPMLRAHWEEFQFRSHENFLRRQMEILRRYTKAPIGTDLMPVFGIDYQEVASMSDILQYNHYHTPEKLGEAAFWFDYLRSLKDRPFWVTETAACWNGAISAPSDPRPEGFCKANSWMPIVLGGEANMYWLWRQHWSGHELMHGAILYASGRPMHIFGEVQELSAEFRKAGDFLAATRVRTDCAMMVSSKSYFLMNHQRVVDETTCSYSSRVVQFHQMLQASGLRPDVIPTRKDLRGYKLLFTPYMLSLEMDDLPRRIAEWVKNGGVWVVGPMTDLRNALGQHYTDRAMGMTEELTGVYLAQQAPNVHHQIACRWADGSEFTANSWLQLYDLPENAERLAETTGDFHSALGGLAVAARIPVGKGQVIVLGTRPDPQDLEKIARLAAEYSGAEVLPYTGSLTLARREGGGMTGFALTEYAGRPASVTLPRPATDLLTGKLCSGTVEIAPYQTMILQED